ncbi:MAG: hypothetical protein JWQ35_2699 [Bacteriovoracaceae bacterium]|nr:hypothetical protein [Bacteriovoracaceae bacterium]
MKFSADEIEKAKEMKRLHLFEKIKLTPQIGSCLFGRHCPQHALPIDEQVFLIIELHESQKDYLWLPTLDETLEITRELKISFSQITDFLHRRRFADGREREGLYQLLIEKLR